MYCAMNERQPYEQLIAEKLQQLPVPDVDASWLQMKRLLDDDQSPTGGAGPRGPRNSRWWWTSLIAIVFTTSLWFYMDHKKSAEGNMAPPKASSNSNADKAIIANAVNKEAVSSSAAENSNNSKSNKNSLPTDKSSTLNNNASVKDNTIHNTAPPSKSTNTSPTSNTGGNSNAAVSFVNNNKHEKKNRIVSIKSNAEKNNNKSATASSLPASKDNKDVVKSESHPDKSKDGKKDKTSSRSRRHITNPETITNRGALVKNNNTTKKPVTTNNKTGLKTNAPVNSEKGVAANRFKNKINRKGNRDKPRKEEKELTQNNNTVSPQVGRNHRSLPGADKKKSAGDKAGNLSNTVSPDENVQAANHPLSSSSIADYASNIPPIQHIETGLAVGDSINENTEKDLPFAKDIKNNIATEQREIANILADKKAKKSLNLHLGTVLNPFTFKTNGEAWWSAGLALNFSVPIGSQTRFNHSVSGKLGTLTDYLPSPYVQFHLNDNVYLQTEINLSSPQHIPQLLVSNTNKEYSSTTGSSYRIQQSIYVQKLYYFNWPFSLHYSPVDNLYLTAGLQFSSMQSGLAQVNEKRYAVQGNDTLFSSRLLKFKDDSIAVKFSPNEWRWQTGVDYYFNRFTLGFRYNRAFKDLLNVSVGTGLPIASNRNAAFLFFMRYNLFEGKRKDNEHVPRSLVRY